jgi:hypothetical protein
MFKLTRKKFGKVIAVLVLSVISLLSIIYLAPYIRPAAAASQNFSSSFSINYPTNWQHRQTLNNCGSYSVAGAIRALYQTDSINSEEVVQNIPWRWPDKFTLPWGLEDQLKKHSAQTNFPNLHKRSNNQKLDYLKSELSQDHPVILLVNETNYEHYIVLLGYNETGGFHIYDPVNYRDSTNKNLTRDDNGEETGNRTLSSDELINIWSRGGILGVYEWYAVVVSR